MDSKVNFSIETRNHFLRLALEALQPHGNHAADTCIIDLTSIHSLKDILHCVQRNGHANRFLFIGNTGKYSRVLLPLVTIECQSLLVGYYDALRYCPGVTYDRAMSYLLTLTSMGCFTQKEKKTIYALIRNETMSDAVRELGVNSRLFYQRVERLAKRLNMLTRLQAHQFFKREFHADYVQVKIDEECQFSVVQPPVSSMKMAYPVR